MPRKGDYHGTNDVDHYRRRIGKNENKQNRMHLKAEKRRKEIVESTSYKVSYPAKTPASRCLTDKTPTSNMIFVAMALVTVLAVVCVITYVLLYGN